MKVAKMITEIRNHATGVRADARARLADWSAGDTEGQALAETVVLLADALDLVADVLSEHQRLLLELRDHKAVAP